MDSGADPLLVTNVTSNGYAMAAETSVYVANRIEGKGNVVMFVFDAFPPVQIRGVIADAVFGTFQILMLWIASHQTFKMVV